MNETSHSGRVWYPYVRSEFKPRCLHVQAWFLHECGLCPPGIREYCGTDQCGAIFSWTKRLLRPAFSDYALFSFLAFFVFFQCTVRYPSNPLPPSYMTHTSSRIFWSFHTSYRVCLVPAESGDSNSACSAGAVAARRQNGVAVPHTEGVGSRQCGAMPAQGGADLHGS